jgi:hypothetical protein
MINLLADENIPPSVVRFLRDRGLEVKELGEAGLAGALILPLLLRKVGSTWPHHPFPHCPA